MLKRFLSITLIVTLIVTMMPTIFSTNAATASSDIRRPLPQSGGENLFVAHNLTDRGAIGRVIAGEGLIGGQVVELYISSRRAQELLVLKDASDATARLGNLQLGMTLLNAFWAFNPATAGVAVAKNVGKGFVKTALARYLRTAVRNYDFGYGIIITANSALADQNRVVGPRSQLMRLAQPRSYNVTGNNVQIFDRPNGNAIGTLSRNANVTAIGTRQDAIDRNVMWYLLDTGTWVQTTHLGGSVVQTPKHVYVMTIIEPIQGGSVTVVDLMTGNRGGGIGNRFAYSDSVLITANANTGWEFERFYQIRADGSMSRMLGGFGERRNELTIHAVRENMNIKVSFVPAQPQQPLIPPPNQPPGQQPTQPPSQPPTQPPSSGLPQQETVEINIVEFERRVLEETNRERAQHGLAPLTGNSSLANVARAHSQDMATNNFFGHIGSDGSSPFDRVTRAGFSTQCHSTENVLLSQFGFPGSPLVLTHDTRNRIQATPERAVETWMNSPGHRANILNPNMRHIGVGVAVARHYEYVYLIEGIKVRRLAQLQLYFTQKFVEDFI